MGIKEDIDELQEYPPNFVLSKKVLRTALDSGCTIKEKAKQERVNSMLPLRLCDLNYSDLPLTKRAIRDLFSAGASLTAEGRLRVSNAEPIRIGDLILPAHKPTYSHFVNNNESAQLGSKVYFFPTSLLSLSTISKLFRPCSYFSILKCIDVVCVLGHPTSP